MTTSRIVRGTKIRIFVCFCAVVVILGLVACYNNTISQLDESQKAVALCHQQQENLSTQLQVISDYKVHIENALKIEKADHTKSNNSYHQVIKEEKQKNEKAGVEAKLRFNSLQQRYNLLQTEHDDYKEKTSKALQEQLDEIDELKSKLKTAYEELKVVNSSKESLKTEYLNLQLKKDDLKKQVDGYEKGFIGNENKTNFLQKQNIDLRRELDELKEKCPEYGDAVQAPVNLAESPKTGNHDNKLRESERQQDGQNVLVMPMPNDKAVDAKSSSTASSVKRISQGSLNGARPLALPTMTPKDTKHSFQRAIADPNSNKLPEGVLPVPNKLPDANEISNDLMDNRYKNQIDEVKQRKPDQLERENGANEEIDPLNVGDEGLGFGDSFKLPVKQNNIQHIDNLGIYKGAPKNEAAGGDDQDGQLEENPGIDEGEDDDQDEYADHLARQKEPAVRN